MLRRSVALCLLSGLMFFGHRADATAVDQTLIAAGSLWKYNDSGADLGTAWRTSGYGDTSWSSGFAQLGYGDGDEATLVSYGPSQTSRYITTYFRRAFTVVAPDTFAALTARVLRDDGVVVYLNGAEVARSNMPNGPVTAATLATTAVGDAAEDQWFDLPIDPSLLVNGTNVIAVELHQSSATSSDISFDFQLIGTEAVTPPPVVTLVTPGDHGLSNQSTITFTAQASAVAGLASATLYISGPPKTAVFSGQAQIEDAQISADTPTAANGAGLSINVDGLTPHVHGLMKFPSLVGAAGGQVPAGAVITSATLRVNCTNPGNAMQMYRLTQSWDENTATWNQRQTGAAWGSAGADGAASNAGVAVTAACGSAGLRDIDITRFVQEWINGAANHGLVFVDSGTDGIDFDSSESASSPVLTVTYKDSLVPLSTQALTGTSATIEFPASVPQAGTWLWNVRVTDTNGAHSWAGTDFEFTMDPTVPDEPVLVSPGQAATGVSPTTSLQALVGTPGGGTLTVTASIRKRAAEPFTIIALPDTQHYSEAYPAIFTSQTQWIKDQKAARNIVFVTHEGDIVQNYGLTAEWDRANTSMSILDGVVPYGMGPGNHDQPTTLYNQYFPYTRYAHLPWYGGHYQSLNDNNFQLFSAGGLDFVIVHLEFCPPAGAVTWAAGMLNAYPNRIGMMTTHGYLNEAAQRTVHGCTDTSPLWNNLALQSPNLHFMLSGHVHDEARRSDVAHGHPVYQMLADYQDRASGGEGWLRILRFIPAENRVHVQTYSPWLNQYETDANSEFSLDFPMAGPYDSAGSTIAVSGSIASVNPAALQPNTEYEWTVTVTNAAGKSRTGPVWRFTTGVATTNQPPVAAPQSLSTSEDQGLPITLTGSDPENATLTYSVVTLPAHGVLSGVAPNLVYQPAANYNGPDAFTFRVNDGNSDSDPATVNLTVQPVNDSPVAVGETFTVQSGSTLSVPAPGVLTNDADVEGSAMTAQMVTPPAHGVATLSPNGALSYTPASGYAGSDSITYRANDGQLLSNVATIAITVTPAPVVAVLTANFNSTTDGFAYVDDAFRGTSQPAYASGARVSSGGFTGGALRVDVAGTDNKTVTNMSGGWQRTFTLTAPTSLVLSFRYNLDQGNAYESNEFSQVLASLNGALVAPPGSDSVAVVTGNGNGGSAITTGWRLVEINLGTLAAGTHTLRLGGFNNRKDASNEKTAILIDDVSVIVR